MLEPNLISGLVRVGKKASLDLISLRNVKISDFTLKVCILSRLKILEYLLTFEKVL